MTTITGSSVVDLRYPSSKQLDGSVGREDCQAVHGLARYCVVGCARSGGSSVGVRTPRLDWCPCVP